MARVVSLSRARKAAKRIGARAQADANAVKFGRSKAGKQLEAAQAEKARADLDGHERDADAPDPHMPDK